MLSGRGEPTCGEAEERRRGAVTSTTSRAGCPPSNPSYYCYIDHQPSASMTPQPMRALSATLSELGDTNLVHGEDAKALRDATAHSIAEVWKNSKASTALLAQQSTKPIHNLSTAYTSYFRLWDPKLTCCLK
ncbi:hypothetical protein OESDEN_00987 [Oesophagostomum dentatum]|uniref:Uncharacterized protein n=1 Tax=Oesophagostomum dentatum TaxID=61180 RepID=A0A0B1TUC0_OESDE|nr:hypothetical protein OESDEN_00987 [Oesophagostomum dentatum]